MEIRRVKTCPDSGCAIPRGSSVRAVLALWGEAVSRLLLQLPRYGNHQPDVSKHTSTVGRGGVEILAPTSKNRKTPAASSSSSNHDDTSIAADTPIKSRLDQVELKMRGWI